MVSQAHILRTHTPIPNQVLLGPQALIQQCSPILTLAYMLGVCLDTLTI